MGLLSTEVEVKLGGRNIKWFEEKGYNIPRRMKWGKLSVPANSKILVKVEDLQKGSHTEVECVCDFCGKIKNMEWCMYQQINHNGKIYCSNCVKKIYLTRELHPNWNPKLTDEERQNGRNYQEYADFIQKVLARDNYTCVITGKDHYEAELEVHHLNGYDWCIEGRTDVKNAITITKELHKSFHIKYGYGHNTKEQFLEFVGMIDIILEDYNGEIPTSRWAYCISDNEIIKNVNQYARNLNISPSHIYECCNKSFKKTGGKIYLWYDIYKKMSEEEINAYIKECEQKSNKKIVCENYKLLFDNAKNAGIFFNIDSSGIIKCCKGKIRYCGKIANSEKLIWKYAKDVKSIENYTFISKEECKNQKEIKSHQTMALLLCKKY